LFLQKALESNDIDLSKSQVRKLIMIGCVFLNHKRCKQSSEVIHPKDHLKITFDPDKLIKKNRKWEFHTKWVVHEDESIIVINKPSGLPTQATVDQRRDHLYGLTLDYLKTKTKKAYLGLHHRLDVGTSGLVLFTKQKEANRSIATQFKSSQIKKIYLALCHRSNKKNKKQWTQESFLKKVRTDKKRSVFGSVKSGGKKAVTHFKILKQTKAVALIEAKPITGRTHQIRVHLLESDFPIIGDSIYKKGNSTKNDSLKNRLHLHAATLSFTHPKSERQLTLHSSPDFLDHLPF